MRTGEALRAVQLRPFMHRLMLRKLLAQNVRRSKRIVNIGNRLIFDRQLFRAAGKFGVEFRSTFFERLEKAACCWLVLGLCLNFLKRKACFCSSDFFALIGFNFL